VGEAVLGRSGVRHGQGKAGVGRRQHGAGCDGNVRSSWWRRWRTSQRVEEMREGEREKREKERVGLGILAYVHRVDASADEHKRAGLRGDRVALCSSAT
jgi:hypothetical protein